MGQILDDCARTTAAGRWAIQNSQESMMILATRNTINPKTVLKWKKRKTDEDSPMGPKESSSAVLTKPAEALIVAFRKHTLLPLDDCLHALQEFIPGRSCSLLHRCPQRLASAKTFLGELIAVVPYTIHTTFTDNGIQFADRSQNRNGSKQCSESILLTGTACNMVLSTD